MDSKRLEKEKFKVGSGISGWVAQFKQAALVVDVRQDNRFNRAIDRQLGFNTKSVLCIPVLSQKRNYGVFEAINRKAGQFSPQDQEFLTLLGRQAAVAYQNLLLIEEVSQTKVLLESLVGNLTGGLMAMDRDGRLTVLNPSAAVILGLSPGHYTGRPAAEVLSATPWFVDAMKKTQESQATLSRQEVVLNLRGIDTRIGYSTILIADPQKTQLGSGIIFQKL
jgi:adenylate cyclase